jgi:hypothetical protein
MLKMNFIRLTRSENLQRTYRIPVKTLNIKKYVTVTYMF